MLSHDWWLYPPAWDEVTNPLGILAAEVCGL